MANRWAATWLNIMLDYMLRNQAIAASVSMADNNGKVLLKAGAVPASPEVAVFSGEECSLAAVADGYWSAAAGGIAEWAAPRDTGGAATGSPITYALMYNTSSGQLHGMFTVGVAGSGAGIILNTLTTTVGVPLTIENFGLKMPLSLSTVKINTALANRLLDGVTGKSPSTPTLASKVLNVYSGDAPNAADDAATGTLLGTASVSNTTWAAGAGGASALSGALSVTDAAAGTAGYVRIVFGALDDLVIQGSVGLSGSGADFIFDTLTFTGSGTHSITAATITLAQP